MTERIIADVVVAYKDGTTKDIVAEAKALDSIEECEKGTIVILMDKNGDNLTGLFSGVTDDGDEELILISSVDDSNNILGFPKYGLEEFYFEEINEMLKGEAEIIQNFED